MPSGRCYEWVFSMLNKIIVRHSSPLSRTIYNTSQDEYCHWRLFLLRFKLHSPFIILALQSYIAAKHENNLPDLLCVWSVHSKMSSSTLWPGKQQKAFKTQICNEERSFSVHTHTQPHWPLSYTIQLYVFIKVLYLCPFTK